MIYQITDPTKMLETLAAMIIKNGAASDALVFVPTRRAARSLEKILAAKSGGACLLPRIVPLGEGEDPEDSNDSVSNMERAVALAKLLENIDGSGFANLLPVAHELTALYDHLENEGVDARAIDWRSAVKDEKKAMFLDAIKTLDFGRPTATEMKNRGIADWRGRLSEYGRVYCCGSTASVKSTADLMSLIAQMADGNVILPGLLGNFDDIGRTDPYYSIKRFLAGRRPETIDVGAGRIGFFNDCFSNALAGKKLAAPSNITQIDLATEAEEAETVAAISAMAKERGERALIITPDQAGGQRIMAALSAYDLTADSSDGTPLSQTKMGRIAGLAAEYFTKAEKDEVILADLKQLTDSDTDMDRDNGNLFSAVDRLTGGELSDIIENAKILEKRYGLDTESASAVLRDMIKKESVRAPLGNYDVAILGTAEARMQTADIVILTGLNDGMFPSDGFRHSWLSDSTMEKIGLPSPDGKVSLMALDFMTLSCGARVYWTRSKMSGGTLTTPSRFLSRVSVRALVNQGSEVLAAVRARDDVEPAPLDRTAQTHKYEGAYYATWLEDLIHNPYQFYAKHILRLRVRPDIGDDVGPREFGTLVHKVLEDVAAMKVESAREIEMLLEKEALEYIPSDNVLFKFWQNRFHEMASAIFDLAAAPGESEKELSGEYRGRTIKARADRVEKARVIDYKTGNIPTDAQLGIKDGDCMMPQLPVEAMLSGKPEMAFLRLQRKRVKLVEFDAGETSASISAAKKKLDFLFAQDTYGRPDHWLDDKYTEFDDLCRQGD